MRASFYCFRRGFNEIRQGRERPQVALGPFGGITFPGDATGLTAHISTATRCTRSMGVAKAFNNTGIMPILGSVSGQVCTSL